MPLYEYYCPSCTTRFEELRPVATATATATCPQGHAGAKKLLSVFATVTSGGDAMPADASCGAGACCATPSACNMN